MYRIIKDNIVQTNNGVSFIYRLKMFNTEFNSKSSNSENHISNIISKINKSGEIIIVPDFLDSKDLSDYYEKRNIENELNVKLNKQLYKETIQVVSECLRFKYKVYLVINSSNIDLNKKRTFFNFDDNFRRLTKNDVKLLDEQNKEHIKIIREYNYFQSKDSPVLNFDETFNLLKYLYVPKNNEDYDDYICEIKNDYILYNYETPNGVKKKRFATYFQVSKLPEKVSDDINFNFLTKIKKLKSPVDIVIKFNIKSDDSSLEKELGQVNSQIRKSQRRRKKHYDESLYEEELKRELSKEQQKDAEINQYSRITHQINIRISSNYKYKVDGKFKSGLYELRERYVILKKIFNSNRTKVVTCFGKQEQLMNNFCLGNITNRDNQHIVNEPFLNKYKTLETFKLGNEDLRNSVVNFYSYPNKYPIFVNPYAPLERDTNVKVTSPVTLFTGTTGSGKSQMANNDVLLNIITNEAYELIIDPKGDRKGFINKLELDGIDSNVIGNEFVIGTGLEHKGCLDPFERFVNNKAEMYTEIATFIRTILEIDSKLHLYDAHRINELLDVFMSGSLQHNMVNFVRFLKEVEESYYKPLSAYENYSYSNLFYSDGNSNSIVFDKHLTIIIIEEIGTNTNEFDIKNRLFNLVLDKIGDIAKKFMRQMNGKKFGITLEEIGYLKGITDTKLDDELSRLIRSFGGLLRLVTQNYTDISKDVHEQVGSYVLGNGMSTEQLEVISNDTGIKVSDLSLLLRTNDNDEDDERDKYVFMYIDNNKNKGYVRQEFLPMFKKAMDTKLKEKS